MRVAFKALAVTAATTLLATGTAVAAPPSSLPSPKKPKFTKTIQPALFGMHVHALSDPVPQVDQKFGAIRIWDNGVRWDQINTAKDVYDFTLMDQVVKNAKATGAQRLMYVLGSTPEWLASDTSVPNYLEAPGANSMPKDLDEWDKWVRTVVSKYADDIDRWQIWNEVNFSSFFTGSPAQMVELTKRASKIIREEDPTGQIVTGSAIVRQFKKAKKVSKQSAAISSKSFFYQYMSGLKKQRVAFDAVGMHLYPWFKAGPGDGSPADRERAADQAQKVLDHFKFRQPMYDTEMSYGNRRDNGWRHKVYPAKVGAAYLAQTYIYGMVNNVPEVYWYGWDDHVLGIDVTTKDGTILPPGVAYNTVMNWMSNAKNGGCADGKGGVHTCVIKQLGQKQYMVFRDTNSSKTYKLPASWQVGQACDVNDDCSTIKKGRLKVGLSPLLLKK